MASYAADAEDTPVDRAKRTLAFASATSSEAPTPAGPPLSPYRDPSANCDPSEAPTPVRERRRESPPPDEPENAEEESLRLALELQEREERYAREQEEGAARHAELSQRRREEASSDGEDDEGEDPRGNHAFVGSMAYQPNSPVDVNTGDEGDEEEEEDDYDESLALAWRLQQEDDDRALLMAMNGGIEPPEGATERSLSPSQMTYDQLLQLGENVGKVSKGTDQKQLDDLPTCTYGEAKSKGESFAILGEQCAVCRCEYDDDDIVRILPCRHAEHAECLDQWLLRNRSCPLCQRDVGTRAGASPAKAPAPSAQETHFTAADTDDIDDLLGI